MKNIYVWKTLAGEGGRRSRRGGADVLLHRPLLSGRPPPRGTAASGLHGGIDPRKIRGRGLGGDRRLSLGKVRVLKKNKRLKKNQNAPRPELFCGPVAYVREVLGSVVLFVRKRGTVVEVIMRSSKHELSWRISPSCIRRLAVLEL